MINGKRPLKVLYVLGVGGFGGIGRHVQCLVKNVDRSQIEPHVCVTFSPGPISDEIAASGVPVHVIGAAHGHSLKILPRFLRIIMENRIELVHAHQLPLFCAVAMWLWTKVPLVASIHVNWEHIRSFSERIRHVILSLAGKRVDGWIAVSEDTLSRCARHVRENGVVLLNPVPIPNDQKKDKAWLANELGVKEDVSFVGMVGRMEPHDAKDWPAFLRICVRIAEKKPSVHFVAVGDGRAREAFESSSDAQLLQGRLHWLGSRRDVYRIVAALDVFLITSKIETFCLTLTEAMSVKTPVAGFIPEGGVAEILACAEGGAKITLLRKDRDDGCVATDVLSLLTDVDERSMMAERAYRIIEKHFNVTEFCQRLVDIYAQARKKVALRADNVSGLAWLLVVLVPLLCSIALLVFGPRVSPDSASYLECASNIACGEGMLAGLWDGLDAERWVPISLWPPGFPLLVSVPVAMGVPVVTAGWAVSFICTFVAIGMVVAWFASRFAPPLASLLALVFTSMFSLAQYASTAWSDGPYLMVAQAALLMTIRSMNSQQRGQIWYAFLAGVLTGGAWCIRNVGLALIGSIGLFLIVQVLYSSNRRCHLARLFAWGGGCVFGGSWLIWRNIHTFGSFSPYAMPPSELSVAHNAIYSVWIVLSDFFVFPMVGIKYAWVAVAVGSVGLLMLFYVLLRLLMAASVQGLGNAVRGTLAKHGELVLVVLYAAVYSVLIIITFSVFRLGETVNSRYMSQIYPAILFVIGYALSARYLNRVWYAGLCVVVGMNLTLDVYLLWRHSLHMGHYATAREVATKLCADAGRNRIIVTDEDHFLRCYGNVNARMLSGIEYRDRWELYDWTKLSEACERGDVWGCAIQNAAKAKEGRFGPVIQRLASGGEQAMGFVREPGYGDWLVFRWVGLFCERESE